MATRARQLVAVLVLALTCFALPAMSGHAQTSDKLEQLKQERRKAQAEAATQAKQVDAASAEVDALTAALQALQTQVNAVQGRLDEAQRSLSDAEARSAAATLAVVEQQSQIELLKQRLADRAVESFINQGDEGSIIVQSADPSEAVRMQALVKNVAQNESDVVEALKGAEEDLVIQEKVASDAEAEAAAYRDTVQVELAALDSARAEQATLTDAAEARLDAELNELASIKALDADFAAQISTEANRLAEELARKRVTAPRPTSSGGGGGPVGAPVGPSSIVSVRGIQVHQSIADQLERMLAAAAADGIALSGGGYRSADGQIAVRRNNCGSSDYAVWQMPPSQCRPPTARPGSSNHERGLAVDFTANGSLIRSRSNEGFKWLAAHASGYGFRNLPSEPWHWSTNGN